MLAFFFLCLLYYWHELLQAVSTCWFISSSLYFSSTLIRWWMRSWWTHQWTWIIGLHLDGKIGWVRCHIHQGYMTNHHASLDVFICSVTCLMFFFSSSRIMFMSSHVSPVVQYLCMTKTIETCSQIFVNSDVWQMALALALVGGGCCSQCSVSHCHGQLATSLTTAQIFFV